MADLIEQLQQVGVEESKNYDDEDFVLRGLWHTNLLFCPNTSERIFDYSIVLAQTQGQGCSYGHPRNEQLPIDLIGKDARTILPLSRSLRIAILDAIFSIFPVTPALSYVLDGYASQKVVERTEIVVNEVLQQVKNIGQRRPKVVNVGVVRNFLNALQQQGLEVKATDLDENIIGTIVNGVEIESGEETLSLVADSDVALVTGMTLSTGSLGAIIETAKSTNTKLILFAETGANFCDTYCNLFDVDVAISELFPFYIFQGRSIINVFHRK